MKYESVPQIPLVMTQKLCSPAARTARPTGGIGLMPKRAPRRSLASVKVIQVERPIRNGHKIGVLRQQVPLRGELAIDHAQCRIGNHFGESLALFRLLEILLGTQHAVRPALERYLRSQ